MKDKRMRQDSKVIKLPGNDIPVKKVAVKTNVSAVVKILKSIASNVNPAASRH